MLENSSVSFLIEILEENNSSEYVWRNQPSEIEIFKDYTVNPSFFTQVNSHKPEEIIARAFMQENEYDDLVLFCDKDGKYYLNDNYPNYWNLEKTKQNADKRSEGWNKFINLLRKEGRIK